MLRCLIAALLCTAAFAASAQIYRWTDDKGRVNFSSMPPPPGAKEVRKKDLPAAAPAAGAVAEPYVLQQARKNFPVSLYSIPGSDTSDEARKLLDARGVPFKEVSVTDTARLEELKNVAGTSAVPVMIVGRTVQKGFNQDAYHRLLDEAGYPKTGMLPPRAQAAPKSVQPAADFPPPETARPGGRYSPDAIR